MKVNIYRGNREEQKNTKTPYHSYTQTTHPPCVCAIFLPGGDV